MLLRFFFVLNVDNELVTDEMLSDLQHEQEEMMFSLKTESVISIADGNQVRPNIIRHYKKSFPASVSRIIGLLNMAILTLGGLFFIYMGYKNSE